MHSTTVTTEYVTVSYLCLHHQGPVHAQIMDDAIHIHNIFPFNLEDQTVDGYEGTCASDTSTDTQTREKRKTEYHIKFLVISETVTQSKQKCVCLCVCGSVRPAVDHSRRVSGVLVHVLSDQMSEADEELGGFWYPVIGPGCEVEVTH